MSNTTKIKEDSRTISIKTSSSRQSKDSKSKNSKQYKSEILSPPISSNDESDSPPFSVSVLTEEQSEADCLSSNKSTPYISSDDERYASQPVGSSQASRSSVKLKAYSLPPQKKALIETSQLEFIGFGIEVSDEESEECSNSPINYSESKSVQKVLTINTDREVISEDVTRSSFHGIPIKPKIFKAYSKSKSATVKIGAGNKSKKTDITSSWVAINYQKYLKRIARLKSEKLSATGKSIKALDSSSEPNDCVNTLQNESVEFSQDPTAISTQGSLAQSFQDRPQFALSHIFQPMQSAEYASRSPCPQNIYKAPVPFAGQFGQNTQRSPHQLGTTASSQKPYHQSIQQPIASGQVAHPTGAIQHTQQDPLYFMTLNQRCPGMGVLKRVYESCGENTDSASLSTVKRVKSLQSALLPPSFEKVLNTNVTSNTRISVTSKDEMGNSESSATIWGSANSSSGPENVSTPIEHAEMKKRIAAMRTQSKLNKFQTFQLEALDLYYNALIEKRRGGLTEAMNHIVAKLEEYDLGFLTGRIRLGNIRSWTNQVEYNYTTDMMEDYLENSGVIKLADYILASRGYIENLNILIKTDLSETQKKRGRSLLMYYQEICKGTTKLASLEAMLNHFVKKEMTHSAEERGIGSLRNWIYQYELTGEIWDRERKR